MRTSNAPAVLWDYCFELAALIRSHTCLNLDQLEGKTPETMLLGDTADISFLSEFAWYDYVWYHVPTAPEMQNRLLGRWLGPSTDCGEAMSSYILTQTAQVVSRTSVFPLSAEDRNSEAVTEKKRQFETRLAEALGPRMAGMDFDDDEQNKEGYIRYEDDEPVQIQDPDDIDDLGNETDAFDRYISAKVLLPSGDDMLYGTVLRRKRDVNGNLIGKSHSNPILDTSVYEVMFDNGHVEAYNANLIAENIYARTDEEGHTIYLLDEIIDHRKKADALSMADGYYEVGGQKKPKITTRGWEFCVQWKDASTSWVPLKLLKESNPIELADYVSANGLTAEPAFAWWVPFTLKQRDRIIKATKKKYFRQFSKFGLELPKTVQRALEIDNETGTTYWRDAINKEMKTVFPAFEFLDEGKSAPPGFNAISCHLVFDIKFDFTRKARFVANPHGAGGLAVQNFDYFSVNTYASVVSRESVRIALTLAALNDLQILSADIQGAYLNAPCREKIYVKCGPEFGEYEGRVGIIRMALYGLLSSGAAWRATLAEVLSTHLEFKQCKADQDVWFRAAQRLDGTRYYEYILVYTDDILAISTDPRSILTYIDQHFTLKPGSIAKPTQYLGTTISEFRLDDDPTKVRWALTAENYIKEAIRNVNNWLESRGRSLKTKTTTVLPSGYRPELDVSELLNEEDASYYMQQIGVLRWAVELARVDICCEVSMMAAFNAMPRRGHLEAVFHIFAYLNSHLRSFLVLDDSYVDVPLSVKPDWSDFYPDVKEELPPSMPEPLGKSVQTICFVDADHAGDRVSRRSRTGYLIFLNRALIDWFSKKQNSVETSVFGSEFCALKTATEKIIALRYKLRMMGVPLEDPTFVRVDNMSVVYNSSIPQSVLKKKSNSIAYHFVREAAAAGIIQVDYEPTNTNLADICTKTQAGPKRRELCAKILY